MFKIIYGVFAASAIFFIAANAMAQDLDVSKGSWWMDDDVVEALGLKENEIEQFKKDYWEYRSQVRLIKSEIWTNQRKIDSWKAKNSSNPQGKERIIRKLEGKVEKAHSMLTKVKAPYVAKVRKRLGPERFEKLINLKR